MLLQGIIWNSLGDASMHHQGFYGLMVHGGIKGLIQWTNAEGGLLLMVHDSVSRAHGG